MEKNTDWKIPAALILAGLALLIALNGNNGGGAFNLAREAQVPQIVINGGTTSAGPTGNGPAINLPTAPQNVPSMPGMYGSRFDGGGHRFSPFGLIIPIVLLLLAFRFFSRRKWNRHGYGPGPWRGGPGWGGPGWQGGPGGPGGQGGPGGPNAYWGWGPGAYQQQGQQPPQQQGPQSGRGPGEGPGHWEWHPEGPASPSQPRPDDNHGDIMRPGEGNQE